MSEKILKALMRLFAIIAKSDFKDGRDAKTVVKSYLKQLLNKEQVYEYLALFEEYLNNQEEEAEGEKKKRRLAVSSVKVIVICNQINAELTQKQKFIVLLNLIDFIKINGANEQEMEFVTTVSSSFNIPEHELNQCLELATKNSFEEFEDSNNFLIIKNKNDQSETYTKNNVKFYESESLLGQIIVLNVESIGTYLIRYIGSNELFLNGQIFTPEKIYIFSQGSSIRGSKIHPIYYSDIVSCYLNDTINNKLEFHVKEIEYKFKNGKIGLQKLSLSENSGKLIGIMGGSGAGKSTLLNILNGNNKPSKGEVLVNGYNLHTEKKSLEGVIGFIPQDDMLIEELTVYQNLFYNSKLCFNNYDDKKIHQIVIDKLNDLGLIETKDLKVGNFLNKVISGGQRKRLNIALELIREPSVLFIDEPTSGLSSRDSENIMDLLKELALKGKLVFVVIHQPSSDIFKMFDKLLILDNGGYPIYYGNPVESVIYFKTVTHQVNAKESECNVCGNVNPEQIFNIIESKIIDENGNQTRNRKISPEEWNELYNSSLKSGADFNIPKGKLPIINTFKKPNLFKQFQVFIERDILSKLSNMQYLFINLLEAPLLAFILAVLIKYYKNNQEYIFSENRNMPAYLFMCVIVSLFLGLTVSAEEIIRDRRILKRESFLNLSKGSYLTSKILIMFFISAIQTLTFVLIGNYIMEIRGMYLDYWLVLFTTSCFANMLGLNISSAFNSAVTIYILIPFLLIPQMLLSGVIVKFEELNPKVSSQILVPFSGELMASRWAFEALAVNQYINNDYEKQIYQFDKEMSNATFKKVYWASKMNDLTEECLLNHKKNNFINEISWKTLKNELSNELKETPAIPLQSFEYIMNNRFDENIQKDVKEYIQNIKKYYSKIFDNASKSKDKWFASFEKSENGKTQLFELLHKYHNTKIEDLVKNFASDLDPLIVDDERLIATTNPIYRDGPKTHFIRSHFFAPTKNAFSKSFSTYWVNIIVIWGMSILLWITLYFDVLRKLVNYRQK